MKTFHASNETRTFLICKLNFFVDVDWCSILDVWFAEISDFSQKLTSWVFNDQPCECADVGQSRTIGRAAKIGWEKKWLRKWLPRFLSVKSLIGRFYWEETGDRRVIPDPAARIRFYLHKEFRAAEIWFSLHKEFRDGEIIGGRCVRKWRFSKRETAFAGYTFFQELSFYIQKEMNSWIWKSIVFDDNDDDDDILLRLRMMMFLF